MFFSTTAWAASQSLHISSNTSTWHAIIEASLVVQLTLLCLVAMSVVSWAIMGQKKKQYDTVNEANNPFEDNFWKAASLEEVYDHLNEYPESNLASVFRMGYLELKKIADSGLAGGQNPEAPSLRGIDNLQRALRKAIDIEIDRLETRLTFLATVGSVGPFIGLFGTVWGIMNAFQNIGSTGMASLAVVAPGIAEALITTAVGLAAAIPASIAYNHFVTRIKREELVLNNFASDFLNLAKRNFFRDQ